MKNRSPWMTRRSRLAALAIVTGIATLMIRARFEHDMAVATAMNGLRALGVVSLGFAAINILPAMASGVLGWRLARRIERGHTD
mgnify:CR=1 FL=1